MSILQSLETHPTMSLIPVLLQTLALGVALIKAFTSWLNRSPMTHHICSTVVRHTTVPYRPILMQILMSCGRHWYFFCMWHLHHSFAARFSKMPYFRQSLCRNAIAKFDQILYIYRKTFRIYAYNFSIKKVDRQCVSIRFLVFEKKILLLLNRSVLSFPESIAESSKEGSCHQ